MLKRKAPSAIGKARIAVIGCGGWTQGWHLPNLANREDAVIAALVDPSDQPGKGGCMPANCMSMSELVEKYGAPRFNTLEELLASDTPVDGIICATSHIWHKPLGETALKAVCCMHTTQ